MLFQHTLSSSNRFLCASRTSSLAEGREEVGDADTGLSEEEGEEGEDAFRAVSFSDAALITGLQGGMCGYSCTSSGDQSQGSTWGRGQKDRLLHLG